MKLGGLALVTGAAGFAGSHLVEHLLERGDRVVALDHPAARTDNLATVSERIEYFATDLANADPAAVALVVGGRDFDAVYHLAGLASVRRSFEENRRTLEVNAFATFNLLEALLQQKQMPRLLLVGSAEEYGHGQAGPDGFSEESPLEPVSPYALSKVWQEVLGDYYARTRGWPVLLTRTFNHTGPRQSPDFVCADFARQIARIEYRLAEPVLHVGNLSSARDFLDVRDVVRAYRLILERGRPGQAYNVCSGRSWTIAELLLILLGNAAVRIEVDIDASRRRQSDLPVLIGNLDRLARDTGWTPRFAIEETLRDLLEFWRERASIEAQIGSNPVQR